MGPLTAEEAGEERGEGDRGGEDLSEGNEERLAAGDWIACLLEGPPSWRTCAP